MSDDSIKVIGWSHCGRLEWGIDGNGLTVLTKAASSIVVRTNWIDYIRRSKTPEPVFTIIDSDTGETFLRAMTSTGQQHVWRLSEPYVPEDWETVSKIEPITVSDGRWPD